MIGTSAWPANTSRVFAGNDVDEVGRELPATRLAITYVLLVPLILFAAHGGFSFEHSSWNSDLGAHGGKIAVRTTAGEAMRDRIQTVTGLGLCLAAMAGYIRKLASSVQVMPLMWLLPLYAIGSALWSQDPGTSLRSGVSLLITTLFALYLAERFSERQQMELFSLAGAAVAGLSLATALLWPEFGLDHQVHEGALQGIFTQKNACAEATLFLLTPALALPAIGRSGQMLRSAYLVAGLLIIFMTQSRTGWAITLLYIAFAATLRMLARFGRKEALPVAGLCFTVAASLLVAAIAYPAVLLSLLGRSGGFSGRMDIWTAILASIFRRPWSGYGFDAFWSNLSGEATRIFAATGWVVTSAHSGFLNVALELGLIGLVLVSLTFVQAIRHANASFRPGHSAYVEWCIGVLFLTIVYNLDERTLMAPQYLPWILYIVAYSGLRKAALAPEPATLDEPNAAEVALAR